MTGCYKCYDKRQNKARENDTYDKGEGLEVEKLVIREDAGVRRYFE